jgi:hypothetical protein
MKIGLWTFVASVLCLSASPLFAQTNEKWEQVVAAAKEEGKVVVSIPSSADLRKGLQKAFKQRYGIQVETVTARGSASVRKIVDEYNAGVHYFDLHVGGSQSIVTGLLPEGILEPVANSFLLPEVKDPTNWWGGAYLDRQREKVYLHVAGL